jgi:mRNA interferase RelE/StbE
MVFDEEAIKFLESLPKNVRERIFQKLLSTKENPFIYFERLSGRSDYKLRIGQFRAIADIDMKNKRIEVTIIGNRQNIYDKI